jgi:hypothetical protein
MVTVMAAAAPRDTIALSTTQLVMNVDETAKLSVVLVSENLKDQPIVWTTSDPLVAEMEVDGTVVARGAGVAVLTASVGEVRAVCAVAVRDVAVTASTTSVEENTAAISFPKMASASYYLVHVYEMVNQQRERLISLKVTLEGGIVIAYAPQRAPAANEIGLNLSYLKPDTPYEVDIEVIRERDNRTEVISTLPLAFRTEKGNVGIDLLSPDAAQAVWRADVLYVENLAGFTCRLIASNGQSVKRFEVNASREWHSMPLPAGLYLLYVEKGDVRKTFKLMVRR